MGVRARIAVPTLVPTRGRPSSPGGGSRTHAPSRSRRRRDFLLAWSNGANDNFKGVATLWGSRTATFSRARLWATVATLAGSLVSVLLAGVLVDRFSGKGVIADEAIDPRMLAAIGSAAALTIFLATVLRMPTSTTHALTGALVGAGWTAAGAANVNWSLLATKFAQPLLLSPLLAVGGAALVYPVLRRSRIALGVDRHTCVCVGDGEPRPVALGAAAAMAATPTEVTVGQADDCVERYRGSLFGLEAQRVVDALHYLSGGAVCFARAVNDTPKIAALLLGSGVLLGRGLTLGTLVVVALAMAAGGWLQSRGVADTMSRRITELNPGQGLTANLLTAGLVLGASRLGLPVSTTHVSCGSIFGIGLATRTGNAGVVAQILTTWVTTLPLGLALGSLFYRALG